MARIVIAWLVHLLTASGAVLGLLAASATVAGDVRAALAWLMAAVVVDAGDGYLARVARVSDRLSWIDGSRLDDVVDYQTYVFVPALLVWRVDLVPPGWGLPVAAVMLLASAFGFSRTDAKTADHYFTGFPSLWNVAVLYLVVLEAPPGPSAAVLLALVALVFVPVRYVYPSRTPVLRVPTLVFGATWSVAVAAMVWTYPEVPRWLALASLAYPAYYTTLSLVLDARRRGAGA